MSDLAEHIKEEETEDLVKLEQAVPTSESRSLAASFKRTKMFVPTRSHPSAPDKPVSVKRVALLVTARMLIPVYLQL